MPTDAPNRCLMYAGSTSIPARKVRTIDAKAATNVSQSWLWREKTPPTATPRVSSIKATVTPTSTEIMLARSASITSTRG